MTFYCRSHPDWEGTDLGKLHDHMTKHTELSAAKDIPGYFLLLRNLVKSKIFEIQGPSRLTDAQVIHTFHGRMPTLGLSVADNERDK